MASEVVVSVNETLTGLKEWVFGSLTLGKIIAAVVRMPIGVCKTNARYPRSGM